jgi:hypothetical protein
MIVFDLFEQDPNFRKPVEYENRKQYGTVNLANFIKAYELSQPVQFDFPGAKSYKLTAQWVDLLGDYYNTLETNADKAQLVYGTLTDYNKTIRLLNDLAQSKLFEKKSSAIDDTEFKSTKLDRLKTQARAKYPAAKSDMEALVADFVNDQEADQQELEKVKSINVKQDELLKQINAINQAQDQEIDSIEDENSSLQKNLDQIRAANAELAKKLTDMSARRASKKQKPEQPATTTSVGTVDLAPDTEPTAPADSGKSAFPTIAKTVTGAGSQAGSTTDTTDTTVDTNKVMPTLQKAKVINLFKNANPDAENNQTPIGDQSAASQDTDTGEFRPKLVKKAAESINEADAIPVKSVVQGYTVEYDPRTKQVTVSRGGQVIGSAINKSGNPKYHSSIVTKIIDRSEEDKYPTDIDVRDVALPMKRVAEALPAKALEKLYRWKNTQNQPVAEPEVAPTEPQPVPARLSDLQSKKQRIDNLASIKQDIEKLQARATRGGRMLPRGLAADLEDYFTTADIDTAYDDMMAKYQKQLGALQQYLGMRKALWSPKKDVHEMKAKELEESRKENWIAYFTDGTKVTVTNVNDETDPAKVRAFFAKKGKTVDRFDYGFKSGSDAVSKPEPHEPGSGTARSARTGEELPEGEGSWKKETPWTKTTGKDPRGKVTHMSDVARKETEKMAKDSSPMGQLFKDFEKIFGKKPPVKEGDVVNINRGGYSAFRDKNDWLDKRDYVQQQLLDPRQRDNYPELKQRLLDINSAGRKLGYTK